MKTIGLLSLLLLWLSQSNGFVSYSVGKRGNSIATIGKGRRPSAPISSTSLHASLTTRLKGCFPYLLPLLDGDHFGNYIYERIPPLGFADAILLGPLLLVYNFIPLSGLIFFLGLTYWQQTGELSRDIRFAIQQAILIDIILFIPELIASITSGQDIPRPILEIGSNFVYYTFMAMVFYSVISILRGRKPDQIPYVSEAAELIIGPF